MKVRSFGLDTSVVLRLLVGEPEDQAQRAMQFVAAKVRERVDLLVSDPVVCETYFALHAHYEVPKRETTDILLRMFDDGPVSPMPGSAVVRTLREVHSGSAKLGLVDRLIHATYHSIGADMVSFEKAARRLQGCSVL